MNDPRKLIDIEADSPVEREFVKLLFKYKIPFEAQPNLLDTMITYLVWDEADLPQAKSLLYLVLHPREKGVIR